MALTVRQILDVMGMTAQEHANAIAELSKAAYLGSYFKDSAPNLREFEIGSQSRNMPESLLRWHVPLVGQKFAFSTDTKVLVDGEPVQMLISAEYVAAPKSPEGISLLHEQLVNVHHNVNTADGNKETSHD